MAMIKFETPNMICLGTISCKEDLDPQPKISINGPPPDGTCDCCGRHINDLKPFSSSDYRGRGDIEGALLVKHGRPMAPPDEEVDRIMEEFFGECLSDEDEEKAKARLIEVYGKENAEDLLLYVSASNLVTTSWECKECITLDTDSYFEVRAAQKAQDHSDCIPLNCDETVPSFAVCPITRLLSDA